MAGTMTRAWTTLIRNITVRIEVVMVDVMDLNRKGLRFGMFGSMIKLIGRGTLAETAEKHATFALHDDIFHIFVILCYH